MAFPYWPGYHPETPILARDEVEGQYGCLGMIIRPIWKCPCINLYIHTLDTECLVQKEYKYGLYLLVPTVVPLFFITTV